MEIPGFYYDAVKKRYFKIDKNSTASHQYKDTVIQAKKEDERREVKRARFTRREIHTPQFPYSTHLDIMSKTQEHSSSKVNHMFHRYSLTGLTQATSLQYSLPTTMTKVAVPPIRNDRLMVSDLTNVYCINRDSLEEEDEEDEIFPHMLWNRVNKSTSILRKLEVDSDIVIRTWFGSLDEPSEVEVLSFNDNIELAHFASSFRGKNRESFNTSDYNPATKTITVCASKCIYTFQMPRLDSCQGYQIADALSIDHRDAYTSFLGFRSGEIRGWDTREKQPKSMSYRPKSLRSVTNVKFMDSNTLVCSSIGSKVQLFDIRCGFDKYIRDFQSTKNVVNVFGEDISLIDGGFFMLHTKNLIEIFDSRATDPIKIITHHDRGGRPILGATWNGGSSTRKSELITLSTRAIEFYE